LALREHLRLTVHSEVFNEELGSRAESMAEGIRPYCEGEDGSTYLRSVVFGESTDPFVQGVGFKISYEHGRTCAAASTAWKYLRGERGIRIVHLVRQDLLKAWISFEVAERSGVWTRTPWEAGPSPVPPFRIDPHRIACFFRRIERGRAWTRRAFRSHPFMEVEYESGICANFEGTLDRVFDFLGVPPLPVRPPLAKQAVLPPCRQVLNLVELSRHFEGTEHERFFRESEESGLRETR
jgi:hypothetical protein